MNFSYRKLHQVVGYADAWRRSERRALLKLALRTPSMFILFGGVVFLTALEIGQVPFHTSGISPLVLKLSVRRANNLSSHVRLLQK